MKGFTSSIELARSDFQRSLKKGCSRKAGDMKSLLSLEEVERVVRISGQVYRGIHPVPVERIIGSVNKGQDFDFEFNPRRRFSQARWERLFVAVIEHGSLPPVDLYKVGCFYFVVDGHHRVSVARRLGMSHVEARVTEHVTQDLTQISEPGDVYRWIRHAGNLQGAVLCENRGSAQKKPAGRFPFRFAVSRP